MVGALIRTQKIPWTRRWPRKSGTFCSRTMFNWIPTNTTWILCGYRGMGIQKHTILEIFHGDLRAELDSRDVGIHFSTQIQISIMLKSGGVKIWRSILERNNACRCIWNRKCIFSMQPKSTIVWLTLVHGNCKWGGVNDQCFDSQFCWFWLL